LDFDRVSRDLPRGGFARDRERRRRGAGGDRAALARQPLHGALCRPSTALAPGGADARHLAHSVQSRHGRARGRHCAGASDRRVGEPHEPRPRPIARSIPPAPGRWPASPARLTPDALRPRDIALAVLVPTLWGLAFIAI